MPQIQYSTHLGWFWRFDILWHFTGEGVTCVKDRDQWLVMPQISGRAPTWASFEDLLHCDTSQVKGVTCGKDYIVTLHRWRGSLVWRNWINDATDEGIAPIWADFEDLLHFDTSQVKGSRVGRTGIGDVTNFSIASIWAWRFATLWYFISDATDSVYHLFGLLLKICNIVTLHRWRVTCGNVRISDATDYLFGLKFWRFVTFVPLHR